jgi:hypothetical protein
MAYGPRYQRPSRRLGIDRSNLELLIGSDGHYKRCEVQLIGVARPPPVPLLSSEQVRHGPREGKPGGA